MTGETKLKCQRLGCNAMFTDDDNREGSCRFHVSQSSHNETKEWTCCKQSSLLETQGCKTGKHTTEKLASAKPVPIHVLRLLDESGSTPFEQIAYLVWRIPQRMLEMSRPHATLRWILAILLFSSFAWRVYYTRRFITIWYVLAVYFANLAIGFISPRVDYDKLTRGPDALKPFNRRLPEFEFWYTTTLATIAALLLTFFEIFTIPNDWLIKATYWVSLSCLVVFTIAQSNYHGSLRIKHTTEEPVPIHVLQLLDESGSTPFEQIAYLVWRIPQRMLEMSRPHATLRWILAILLFSSFAWRVYYTRRFITIWYVLAVYFANLAIGFISPRVDYDKLTRGPDALKPFNRRLPEFEFWCTTTLATIAALLLTFFEIFTIPNDWLIKAAYWVSLSCLLVFTIAQSNYHGSLRSIPPKSD